MTVRELVVPTGEVVPVERCYRPLSVLVAEAVAAGFPAVELRPLVTTQRVLRDLERSAQVRGGGKPNLRTGPGQRWLRERIERLNRLAEKLREAEARTTDGRGAMTLSGLRIRTNELRDRLEGMRRELR